MPILIIANPGGGRGRTGKLLPRLESLLDGANVDYQVRLTEEPGHGTSITEEQGGRFDTVVAFGGDGTVNEIINGLIGSNTHLGVVPIGTGNDFARSCGIPLRMDRAVRTLLERKVRRIDLGMANGVYFGNVVGVGFDAEVNRTSLNIKKFQGTMVFVWATLKTLGKYESIPMRIELDDNTIEESTYLVCVGNGWSVGGGLKLTPHAMLDDGLFDVCHIKDISSLKIVANFLKLTNGKINDIAEVTTYRSRQIRISSEIPLPIHVDGEIPDGEITNLEVELIPRAVSVISNWKDETG